MREFPKWVNDLYDEATVSTSSQYLNGDSIGERERDNADQDTASVSVDFDPSKLKAFIAEHFIASQDGSQFTLTANGKLDASMRFDRDEMKQIIATLADYKFNGMLHSKDAEYKPYTDPDFTYFLPSLQAIKNNLNPFVGLGYQILNLLEIAGVYVAHREWRQHGDPEAFYSLTEGSASANIAIITMLMVLPAVLRNNHMYASLLGTMSKEEVARNKGEIDREIKALKSQLLQLLEGVTTDTEKSRRVQKLLDLIMRPTAKERFTQEYSSFASYLVKLHATAAVFLALFPNTNKYAVLAGSILAGTVEGMDAAFSKVLAIGYGEHLPIILRHMYGVLSKTESIIRAPVFARIANFAPIPWFMAKVGPALWLGLKTKAALELITVLNLSDEKSPVFNALKIAFLMHVAASAMVFSAVFTQYNIDKKLSTELPTKREFSYDQFANRFVGSLPFAALPAFGAYELMKHYDFSMEASVGAAASTMLLAGALNTLPMKYFSTTYEHAYKTIAEARFVPGMLAQIDRIALLDKAVLFMLSAVATGIGFYKEIDMMAGPALFFTTSAAIAMMANISRSATNALRFGIVQTAFYTIAFLNFMLNGGLPALNHFDAHPYVDHGNVTNTSTNGTEDTINLIWTEDNIRPGLYWTFLVAAPLFAMMGALGDYKGQARKVPELQQELSAGQEEESLLSTAREDEQTSLLVRPSFVGKMAKCMVDGVKSCCSKTAEAANTLKATLGQ